jgi:hypothetical protein
MIHNLCVMSSLRRAIVVVPILAALLAAGVLSAT